MLRARGGASGDGSTRRLFAIYAAVTLIPVLLLGGFLGLFTARQANNRGLQQGVAEAQLVARTSIAPQLLDHDLRLGLGRDERANLASTVGLAIRNQQVLRLRVRDLDARVVFSDDGSGIGTIDDEALDAAAGKTVKRLTWLNSDRGDRGGRGPRVVEAYVPLVAAQSNDRIGVLEVYLPYGPIAREISSGTHMLIVTLVSGLLLLWLVLLAVSFSVTGRLRRQAAANAFLARHDTLTGLPNRAQFATRTTQVVSHATPDGTCAVALIDLDRFKEVNDTLGHANGDRLLVMLAERLAGATREGDTVARLGGDEFGLVISNVHGPGEAVEVLSRLRALLSEPLALDALPLAVEASIGFALAPDDGTDLDTLLTRADVAMYVAKREHRGIVRWRPEQDQYDAGTLTLIAELGHAIAHDELVLHYQPKAELRAMAVTAVEALVRWQHPTRGLLYPDAFLPAAEQTELVEPLTKWVLRSALLALPELDASGQLAVAVNISARSLTRTDFATDILAALDETATAPERLILEITETALLADPQRAARNLDALHRIGVRISIDDFGAGQTSLGYLATLPISELKIDKAFVLAMTSDERNAAIVRSVIELGHSLGFMVTAEGVETQQALDDLGAADCDLVQGFLLARPMDAATLRTRLEDRTAFLRPLIPAQVSDTTTG